MRGYRLTQFLLITGWYARVSIILVPLLDLPYLFNPLHYLIEDLNNTGSYRELNLISMIVLPGYASLYLIPLSLALLRSNDRRTKFQIKIFWLGWFFIVLFIVGLLSSIFRWMILTTELFSYEDRISLLILHGNFLGIIFVLLFFVQVWIFITLPSLTPQIRKLRLIGFSDIVLKMLSFLYNFFIIPTWFELSAIEISTRLAWLNLIVVTISVSIYVFLVYSVQEAIQSEYMYNQNAKQYPHNSSE